MQMEKSVFVNVDPLMALWQIKTNGKTWVKKNMNIIKLPTGEKIVHPPVSSMAIHSPLKSSRAPVNKLVMGGK